MLYYLSNWRMCSVLVTFIFFCNVTGAAGLAIASALPQSGALDNASLLNNKLQEVAASLKSVKDDINSSVAPTTHLFLLHQQYEELEQLGETLFVELEAVQADVSALVAQGTLAPEFSERGESFANQYNEGFGAVLNSVSAVLNAGQVSVVQVDSALSSIEELAPGVKATILGSNSRPELTTRRAVIPRRGPSLQSSRVVDNLPTDADMAASPDVRITPEIEALASELGGTATALFLHVKNTIDYQPYYGSVKGSAGIYWEKAGNDVDQASYLIALLRASGIPARYVAGVVGLPIGMAANWVGVENAEAAVEVFSSNGIPSEAITAGSGEAIGLKFFHVWVEVLNDHGRWVGMDPSFKQYRDHTGVDVATIAGVDADALYAGVMEGAITGADYASGLNEANLVEAMNGYRNTLISYIQENMPDATVDDIAGYREVTKKATGLLPPLNNGGVFGISEEKERFSEVPASMRSIVNFQVPGINYTTEMPQVADGSISISYVPATPGDASLLELYGGIFHTPAFLVYMRPLLKVNGKVVAEGSSQMLGSNQVLYSGFLGPEEETWDTNSRVLTVGAEYSVTLDAGMAPLALVKKKAASLEATVASYPAGEPATPAMREAMLHLTGLAYFAEVDIASDLAARFQKIVWTRLPAQVIVAQEVVVSRLFWFPWRVSQGARSIDVKRDAFNPISATGNPENARAWMTSIGFVGSATEHSILESLYGVKAVSTIQVLGCANRQDVPIYTIDSTNIDTILPQLTTFSIVKESIRDAVENGWTVTCPERNITVNRWTGQGWIIADPASGAASYLLAGSLVSGTDVAVVNGGGATEASEESPTGSDIGDFLLHLHDWAVIVMIVGKILLCLRILSICILFGGLIGMAMGLFVFGQLIVQLLYVLAVLWVKLDLPPFASMWRRRREELVMCA